MPVTYEVINQIQIFFIVEFIESQECQFDNLLNHIFLSNWIAQQQIDIQKDLVTCANELQNNIKKIFIFYVQG